MLKFQFDRQVQKYHDPEYNYVVWKRATDDEDDTIWCLEKTEAEAQQTVADETADYDSDDYQFYFKSKG